jgi:hypothetical protein
VERRIVVEGDSEERGFREANIALVSNLVSYTTLICRLSQLSKHATSSNRLILLKKN